MYSKKLMDHFTNPRNVGEMSDADGIGIEGNPTCGDVMKLFIKVEDEKITDAKFQTFGCGAAIAVSSMITEMAKGKSLDEALIAMHQANRYIGMDSLPSFAVHNIVTNPDYERNEAQWIKHLQDVLLSDYQ